MNATVEVGSEWRRRKCAINRRRVVSTWTDIEGRRMVTYRTPGGWEDSMTERGFIRTHALVEVTP